MAKAGTVTLELDADGALERDLLEVDLFEITITPLPCYPGTSVQVMRSDPRAVRKRMLARLKASKLVR